VSLDNEFRVGGDTFVKGNSQDFHFGALAACCPIQGTQGACHVVSAKGLAVLHGLFCFESFRLCHGVLVDSSGDRPNISTIGRLSSGVNKKKFLAVVFMWHLLASRLI